MAAVAAWPHRRDQIAIAVGAIRCVDLHKRLRPGAYLDDEAAPRACNLFDARSRVSQEVPIPRHRAIFFPDRPVILDGGAVSGLNEMENQGGKR